MDEQEEEGKNQMKEEERESLGKTEEGLVVPQLSIGCLTERGWSLSSLLVATVKHAHSLTHTCTHTHTSTNSRKPCRHEEKEDGPGLEMHKRTSDDNSEEPAAGLTD